MIPFALAASLFLTPAAAEAAPAAEAPPAEASTPTGAPTDDYQFVAWCYGALSGYLDLHDQVMPEVTRIESTWRRPGSNLADDLKVYDLQQRQGREDLQRFKAALTEAEKASVQPINAAGAQAIVRGRAVWNISPDVAKARVSGRSRPVVVVPYDDGWPARYAEVAARVRAALGDRVLRLDHVGSTAVPGLAAKPVIDADLTVRDSADEPSYMQRR